MNARRGDDPRATRALAALALAAAAGCAPECPPGALVQRGWNFEDEQCPDAMCGFDVEAGQAQRVEVFPGEHALELEADTRAVYTGARPLSLQGGTSGAVTVSARCAERSSLLVEFLAADARDADVTTETLGEVLVGPNDLWRTFTTTLAVPQSQSGVPTSVPLTLRLTTNGRGRCQIDNVLYGTGVCPFH